MERRELVAAGITVVLAGCGSEEEESAESQDEELPTEAEDAETPQDTTNNDDDPEVFSVQEETSFITSDSSTIENIKIMGEVDSEKIDNIESGTAELEVKAVDETQQIAIDSIGDHTFEAVGESINYVGSIPIEITLMNDSGDQFKAEGEYTISPSIFVTEQFMSIHFGKGIIEGSDYKKTGWSETIRESLDQNDINRIESFVDDIEVRFGESSDNIIEDLISLCRPLSQSVSDGPASTLANGYIIEDSENVKIIDNISREVELPADEKIPVAIDAHQIDEKPNELELILESTTTGDSIYLDSYIWDVPYEGQHVVFPFSPITLDEILQLNNDGVNANFSPRLGDSGKSAMIDMDITYDGHVECYESTNTPDGDWEIREYPGALEVEYEGRSITTPRLAIDFEGPVFDVLWDTVESPLTEDWIPVQIPEAENGDIIKIEWDPLIGDNETICEIKLSNQ